MNNPKRVGIFVCAKKQMKIAVAQVKFYNDLYKNLDNILSFIDTAANEGVNIICFPEMSLTGYNTELLKSQELNQKVDELMLHIKQKCKKYHMVAIIGHPYKNANKLFNRATVIFPSEDFISYDKWYPTEIEAKIFSSGNELVVFEHLGKRFGIAICRDQNYHEIFKGYKEKNCDGAFILAAHFYNPKEARWKIDKNRAIPITRACENQYFVFLANAVGPHLNMISLGHSLIVDGDGCIVVEADEAAECLLSLEL